MFAVLHTFMIPEIQRACMRRRALLSAMTGGLIASLSGCVGHLRGGGASSSPDEWRQFQYDGANGFVPEATGIPDGVEVAWWSHTWEPHTPPVVADGTVFVGSGMRGSLYAFDADTGERLWDVPLEDRIQREIAADGDAVYAVAGSLYAFDATSGEELWSDGSDLHSGVVIDEDHVYTTSPQTVALEKSTGDEAWSRDLSGSTAAIRNGRVYVPTWEHPMGLDAGSGETVWNGSTEARSGPATVTDDRVYLEHHGDMIALSTDDGDEHVRVPGQFGTCDPVVGDNFLFVAGTLHDDQNQKPGVHAVDVETGEVEWTWPDRELHEQPAQNALAGGVLYVSTQYRLLAFDPQTGDRQWWMQFQWETGPPTIADDTIFLSVGGRLLAIESGTGTDGSWPTQAEPLPDRAADPPEPTYRGTDRYFGTAEYDVSSTVSVGVPESAAYDVDITVEGDEITDQDAVEISITVTNDDEEELSWSHGPGMPFGHLQLVDDDHAIIPWSTRYDENRHVHTIARKYLSSHLVPDGTSLDPGETLTETYAISAKTHELRPGIYTLEPRPMRLADDIDVELTIDLVPAGEEDETVVADLAVADRLEPPDDFRGIFEVETIEPVRVGHPGVIEIRFSAGRRGGFVYANSDWPFGSYIGYGPASKRLVLIPEDLYAPGWVEQTEQGWWTSRLLPPDLLYRGMRASDLRDEDPAVRRYIVAAHPETALLEAGDGFAFEHGYADRDVETTFGFTLSVG